MNEDFDIYFFGAYIRLLPGIIDGFITALKLWKEEKQND